MRVTGIFLFLFLMAVGSLHAAEPTTQASNIVVSQISCTSARISWTSGNGAWRLVLVKEASAVDTMPKDGTKYTSFATFGSGSEVGTKNYVCFDNFTNTFTLSGLKNNTTYHIAIFEHDGFGSPDYLTASPATASFKTLDLKFDLSFSYTDSCQNTNNVVFTNKSSTSLTGLKWTWLFGDGNQDTGFNVNHVYTKGGVMSITLIANSPVGCPNSYTHPKPVLIVPRPVSNPVEKTNDTAQCFQGNHFFFQDNTTFANVPKCALQRTWDFGGGDQTTFPSPDKKYANPGKYRIFYQSEILYNNQKTGCTDTTSLYVRVIPDPSSGVSINNPVQCLSVNSFVFDNNYPGLVSYSWKLGDGNTSSNKSVTHSYATTGNYMVIHTAASAEGCSSTDTMFVMVKPNTNASFSGLPASLCEKAAQVTLTPVTPGGLFTGANFNGNNYIPGVPGNYVVKYLVKDSFCPDSTTVATVVQALPRFSLGKDTVLCNLGTKTVNITAPGSVLWENGNTSNFRILNAAGTYWATVDDGGCTWGDTINITEAISPLVNLPADTLVCKGAVVRLSAFWPNSQVSWSNGSSDTMIYVTGAGTYTVTVSNPCGVVSDQVTIRYQGENCDVFVPTAFTPNVDGRNEYFSITGRGITPTMLRIYDRWGIKVFDSDVSKGYDWNGEYNGKPCPDGMYSYVFSYQIIAGSLKRKNSIRGTVLLMR
ncbi:MAG: gliding motility-associated C-terminal domain-containing protein [Bacteroidetes bacterium]|nr:gliding motility-associated C-terminal domain-containing protein [Bacteroidota bacterium]